MTILLERAALRTTPLFIARMLDNPITMLVARLCLTLPFWIGGLSKLVDWQAGEAEMFRAGLHPTWAFNLIVIAVELGGSALVILRYVMWLGAGTLGVFTLLSTLLAHRFWNLSGEARAMELNSFLEHATICAAFILVVVVELRKSKM